MATTRRSSIHPITVAGVILLLGGGGLLAFGIPQALELREFLAGARSTTATVVRLEAVHTPGSMTTNRVILQYTDINGKFHKAKTAISASSYQFSIGERVAILYNHAVTKDIQLDDPLSLWLLPGAFSGVGSIFALVGTFLVIVGFRVGDESKS